MATDDPDKLLTLPQLARHRPGRGESCLHTRTLARWIRSGARAVTGEVVRLEAVRCGGRWVCSLSALERFEARLAGELSAAPPRRRGASRGHQEAMKRLETLLK